MKDISKLTECPICKSNWDAGSILDTLILQRDDGADWNKGWTDAEILADMKKGYAPPYRWGRLIDIELAYDHPNHYDGVSYWKCPDCETIWDRFSGKITKDI